MSRNNGYNRGTRELIQVSTMGTKVTDYTQQLHDEIDRTPEEYQSLLLRIVHSFREGVTDLPSAEDSFREGWSDVIQGKTHPIDELWDGVDNQ